MSHPIWAALPAWAWCGAWLGACQVITSALAGGPAAQPSLLVGAAAGLLFARREPPPPGPAGRLVSPALAVAAACAALTFLDARAWLSTREVHGPLVANAALGCLLSQAFLAGQVLPAAAQFHDRLGARRGLPPALALGAALLGWVSGRAAWLAVANHPRAPLWATVLFALGALTPVMLRRLSLGAVHRGSSHVSAHAFSAPPPRRAARSPVPFDVLAAAAGAGSVVALPAALLFPAAVGAALRVLAPPPFLSPRAVARLQAAFAAGALLALAAK